MQLPEVTEPATRSRVTTCFADANEATPPSTVAKAMEDIAALLCGERRLLDDVELDMREIPAFHRRVYEETRRIPPGTTATYGQIAARVGEPQAARAVGQALGRNPFAIVVPCHRVITASGKLGGFSAQGGLATKFRLLAIEGATGFTMIGAQEAEQMDLFGDEIRAR